MTTYEERNRYFDQLLANDELRWMGQNTNHYPAHPAVKQAMSACIEGDRFHAYAPPLGLEELRQLVLKDLGLEGQTVMITDGAVSGLYHACRTLLGPDTELLTTDPTWAWPMAFAREAGAGVVQVPIYGPENGYRIDPARLRAAVTDKTKLIYIVDPNNPLGTCCTQDEIREIAQIAREAGATLVHDCTYRDFAAEHHLAAHHYPEGTITVWSFSKWLGFAGLRVGALVFGDDLAARLTVAPPNNLGSSVLGQRGAIAGLKVKNEWFSGVLASERRNQQLVAEAVAGVPGLAVPVFPSNGNFLIIEVTNAGIRPEALVAAYTRRNIQIRQGGYHTKAFGDRFVKVSLTVPEAWVTEFCEALPDAVEEARSMNADMALF